MKVVSKGDRTFNVILYIVFTLIAIATIYPFLNVLAISLNDSIDTVKGGITIWPRKFTFGSYTQFLHSENLVTGMKISVLRTVVGTFVGLISSAMVAYTFSRKDFMARKFFSTIFLLTMYISGGLIPSYMLIYKLNLIGSFWVYILPALVSAWNILLIRSFMDSLPYSLQESAMLDGANDVVIFFKIILPLCLPILATVTLFLAVGQWNSWFDTFLYNSEFPSLTTLQYELQKIMQSTEATSGAAGGTNAHALEMLVKNQSVSPESTKMAVTIIATLPILLVYPFVQKYFVQGMTLGAVKS